MKSDVEIPDGIQSNNLDHIHQYTNIERNATNDQDYVN